MLLKLEMLYGAPFIAILKAPIPMVTICIVAPIVLKVFMKRAKPKPESERKSKSEKASAAVDSGLFAKLKAVRRDLADKKKVPAYIVFSDATLIDMCKRLPTNPAEMLEVSGVGKQKLEIYGEAFLEVLREYEKGK